jgi:hypothetical protein
MAEDDGVRQPSKMLILLSDRRVRIELALSQFEPQRRAALSHFENRDWHD